VCSAVEFHQIKLFVGNKFQVTALITISRLCMSRDSILIGCL